MADRIFNFNAMRNVLAVAHNNNNNKAIDKKMVESMGLSEAYYSQWCEECNKLLKACVEYINLQDDYSINHTKALKGKVVKLREAIYPLWKDLVSQGEAESDKKQLRYDEEDVVNLLGYARVFASSIRGTQMTTATPTMFRKKVESFIGCKMAENVVLSEEDRDAIAIFTQASTSYESAKKKIGEIDKQLAEHQKCINECTTEDEKNLATRIYSGIDSALKKDKKKAQDRMKECQIIMDANYKAHQNAQCKIKYLGDVEIPIPNNEECEKRLAEKAEEAVSEIVAE